MTPLPGTRTTQVQSAPATGGTPGTGGREGDRLGKTDTLPPNKVTCTTCGGTGLDPVKGYTKEQGGYYFIVGCPECHGCMPGPDPVARIKLALSLLQHREPSAHLVDLTVRALHGATLEELVQYEAGG